jgi:hypothetical protein
MDLRRVSNLRCKDERPIPALTITPDPVRSGAVLVHDFGACKERMLRMGFALGEMGVACLAIDLAGHGENHSALGPRVRHELEAAVEYMRSRTTSVGCAGVGFGARLALMSSADYIVAVMPLLGVRMFGQEQWVREEVQRLGTEIESLEGDLLLELGPLQPQPNPCLFLYREDEDQSVMQTAFAFHAAHPDSELRKVRLSHSRNEANARLTRRELPFNRDTADITARWLAQLPSFLHPAGAIDE